MIMLLMYYYVYDWTDQQYNSSLTGMIVTVKKIHFVFNKQIVYDLDGTTVLFPVPGKLHRKLITKFLLFLCLSFFS